MPVKNHDRSRPLTRAQQTLVAGNQGLVGWAINRWAWDIHAEEWDDCASHLQLKLIRAAQLFDPARGTFATYASWWLRNGIQCWRLERAKRLEHCHVSLDALTGDAEGQGLSAHTAGSDREAGAALADRDLVRRCRGVLPWRWWRVLYRRCVLGRTLQETADELGISKERVRQIQGRAEALCREKFPAEVTG